MTVSNCAVLFSNDKIGRGVARTAALQFAAERAHPAVQPPRLFVGHSREGVRERRYSSQFANQTLKRLLRFNYDTNALKP